MNFILTFFQENLILVVMILIIISILVFIEFNSQNKILKITPSRAVQLINKNNAYVFDIRTSFEFEKGHIKNSYLLNKDFIPEKIKNMNKDHPIILVCNNGYKSLNKAIYLKKNGYISVYIIEGGIVEWKNSNLILTKQKNKK